MTKMPGTPVVPDVVSAVYRSRNGSPTSAGVVDKGAHLLECHVSVGDPVIDTRHQCLLDGDWQLGGILDSVGYVRVQLGENTVGARA